MRKLYILLVALVCAAQVRAQLIINEVSQGPSTTKEYVEFLVTGTPTCGNNTVDLRGWIIDDNNGWHATGSGTGIAQGCVRFRNIPQWAAVKIGTLILVYNDADAAPSLPADDATDANADCRYIIPISSTLFERHASQPSTANAVYPTTGFVTGGDWNVIAMANSDDGFHTVSPTNTSSAYHSIGWGNNSNNVDIYFAAGGGGVTISMLNTSNNNPFTQANFSQLAYAGNSTPGAPNNTANANWIATLNNNCQPTSAGYVLDTVAVPLCQGDTVNINNQVVSTAGSYKDTIPAIGPACDTIRTYNVTIRPLNTRSVPVALCQGQSTVINGQTITTAGNYLDTIPSTTASCDTVVTYNVTVIPRPTTTRNISLCNGQSIVINGQTVTANGTYIDTVPSGIGCDTIRTNNVTFNPYNTKSVPVALCQGQSTVINGQTVTTAGNYLDTIPSTTTSCDTVVTYNVTAIPRPTTTRNISLCNGQSIVINGQTVTTNGTYTDTVPSGTGCDTIRTNNVTFNPLNTRTQNVGLCTGQTIVINGQTVSTAGTYLDTVVSTTGGCDTVVSYNVTFSAFNSFTANISLCPNQIIIVDGQIVNTPGTYTDTVPGAGSACDTIYTFIVTVNPYLQRTDNRSACVGDVITINGVNYTASTSFTDTVSSSTTCDTIVTYNLVFHNTYNTTQNVAICQGDSYFAGGALQTTAGTYIDNYASVFGCDSNITTILTIVQPSTQTVTANVCVGESYEGTVINIDTTYTVTYQNQTGCDSTVTYNLTAIAKPVVTVSDDITIDEGETVTLTATGGTSYTWSSGESTADITVTPTATTTYIVTVSNTDGCSTIDSAIVTVIPSPEIDVKIPTAFSPNGDGRNDMFDVLNRFQVQVDEFRIYNRWGELVYNNPDGKWDGRFRNTEQPVGVYVYYLKVTYIKSGKQDALSGNVTLLR